MSMKMLWVAVISAGLLGCSRGRPEPALQPERAEASRVATVELEAQTHFGIGVGPARRERLAEYLDVVGTVQPVGSRVAQVRPLARGRVLEVLAGVGDRVHRGQPLVRFDNIEAGELTAQLVSAKAELDRLKVQVASQARMSERNRRLVELGALAQQELERSRAETEALEQSARGQESVIAGLAARLNRFESGEHGAGPSTTTDIRAPFAGVVISAKVASGDVIDPGSELLTVADLSQVWVQAEVYEKDLGLLRVGQTAIISVDAYPNQPFRGRVTYISDALDPQTRTAKVRCETPNPATLLKLDMFANIQLPTTFQRDAITVPADAVQQLDGKDVVFIRKAPNQFEARDVSVGRLVNETREILSGLSEGEPVVTQGSFHLKSVLIGRSLGEE